MTEEVEQNKAKSSKRGKVRRSARVAYDRARQAGDRISEILEKNEKLQKKVKTVKEKVDKVNDLVQPVNDMHSFLLIDAPYVSGQAGMAYEMAFFVSYGTARAKSRIRKVRKKKLEQSKESDSNS